MLAKRVVKSIRLSTNLTSFLASPISLCQVNHFSTTNVVFRGPSKYKSKRNKLKIDKRIQTPEELLLQASNVDIDNLRKDVKHRETYRYIEPNKLWIGKSFPDAEIPENFDYTDNPSNRNFIKHYLNKYSGKFNQNIVWKDLQYSNVNVGDVVDLSGNFEKADLAVVIELPKQPDDPRYTLVNSYGEIQFVSRSKMGLKLPNIFPKKWFDNCVYEEEEFWTDLKDTEEIIPIGKPKYKLEDVVDRNKIFESALAKSITGDLAVKTYILPPLLSGIVAEVLSQITSKAWQYLPDINIKLEVLHNVLQSNEAPTQLTLYQLFNAVEQTNLSVLVKDFNSNKIEDVNQGYKKLLDNISSLKINNQYDSISLGKDLYGEANLNLKVDTTKFYAFMLGLRKNNELYTHDSFTNVSSYVLASPLNRIVKFNKMVQSFKTNTKLYDELSSFIIQKIEKKVNSKITPKFYDNFIELAKLYCAGSIQNSILESFVVKIMRMIPLYKDLDIKSSCIYDLLLKTGEITNVEGPTKWWDNAMIPYSGISIKSDYEQIYYDSITKDNLSTFVDLKYDNHKCNRVEFDDDVIYCIDSVNPLEIDDGISIKKLSDDEFIVSTFVADPSSYLSPDLMISQIAFERGLTLYLPDLAGINSIPLLPTKFGEEIQLGYTNKKTRVLKVSFKYNVKSKKVIKLDDSEMIQFGNAKKFVKIDYDSVNSVLSKKSNYNEILDRVSKESTISSSQISEDLENLSIISHYLNQSGNSNGRILLFEQINVKKEIENVSENENNEIQLTFKDQYNDDVVVNSIDKGISSQKLVSEIMIMSNNLAGIYFKQNNIPAIFKIQIPLEMAPEVKTFADEITIKENSSFKELAIFQEYLTKSTIAPFASKHEFLNIDYYATVTSPLRRFWDLVNHWQLHSYISTGKPMFTQAQINYQALQLKYKDELNNRVSNKIYGFYIFKTLEQLQNQSTGKKGNWKFKVIVTKKPSESGLIDIVMLDYGVKCILETSWYALNENKKVDENGKAIPKNLEIGDIIEDATIKDIDLLDGSIVMVSDSV